MQKYINMLWEGKYYNVKNILDIGVYYNTMIIQYVKCM